MAGFWKRMGAIVRQRCPRCLKGKVFSGLFRMNENCPECGYRFEREQGYFLGAMYASYFISVPAVGLLTWAINEWLVPSWTLEKAIFPCLSTINTERSLIPGSGGPSRKTPYVLATPPCG